MCIRDRQKRKIGNHTFQAIYFKNLALWFSVVLEAVVLGVVQVVSVATKSLIWAAAQPNVSEGVSHDGILFTS